MDDTKKLIETFKDTLLSCETLFRIIEEDFIPTLKHWITKYVAFIKDVDREREDIIAYLDKFANRLKNTREEIIRKTQDV